MNINEKHLIRVVIICLFVIFISAIFLILNKEYHFGVEVKAGQTWIEYRGDKNDPFEGVKKIKYLVLDVKNNYVLYQENDLFVHSIKRKWFIDGKELQK